MKAIGIIAEYNPFHNGHLYHLNTIKEQYKDYKIVLILNGNFTERGDVSIIDKWKRTEIALKEGIDLVIELPFPFATQSADYFSYGAITLLEYLNVEKVVFGSESDNIEDLKLIAKTQLDNEEFDKLVKIYSKFGYNYPTALSLALEDLTGKKITTPNDLLGISYIKTILKYVTQDLTCVTMFNYYLAYTRYSTIRETESESIATLEETILANNSALLNSFLLLSRAFARSAPRTKPISFITAPEREPLVIRKYSLSSSSVIVNVNWI